MQVVKNSKQLVRKSLDRKSLDRKPDARREKIVGLARKKTEFTIQDVLRLLPDVPRRTIERDLETLVTEKKLKSKGEKNSRVYRKWPKRLDRGA